MIVNDMLRSGCDIDLMAYSVTDMTSRYLMESGLQYTVRTKTMRHVAASMLTM
jgi:hypothetical protein